MLSHSFPSDYIHHVTPNPYLICVTSAAGPHLHLSEWSNKRTCQCSSLCRCCHLCHESFVVSPPVSLCRHLSSVLSHHLQLSRVCVSQGPRLSLLSPGVSSTHLHRRNIGKRNIQHVLRHLSCPVSSVTCVVCLWGRCVVQTTTGVEIGGSEKV